MTSELNNSDNLPIAPSLLSYKHKEIILQYMNFINYIRFVTNNQNAQSVTRVSELSEIEDVFYGESGREKLKFVTDLKANFVKELLAPSLVKDVITAAKKDAANFEYKTWGQLIDYCSNFNGTVIRFLLALHDESPTTYIPAASLGVAFQMLINLKNLRHDATYLKKVYIPKDMLDAYDLKVRDFQQNRSSKEIKRLIGNLLKEIRKLLKEAKVLPSITKDNMLRMQFCMMLAAANILYNKIKGSDVLRKNIKLTKFDLFDSYVMGIVDGMFTSYKNPSVKGLKND